MVLSTFLQTVRSCNLHQLIEQAKAWEKTKPDDLQVVEIFFANASSRPPHPPHASRAPDERLRPQPDPLPCPPPLTD